MYRFFQALHGFQKGDLTDLWRLLRLAASPYLETPELAGWWAILAGRGGDSSAAAMALSRDDTTGPDRPILRGALGRSLEAAGLESVALAIYDLLLEERPQHQAALTAYLRLTNSLDGSTCPRLQQRRRDRLASLQGRNPQEMRALLRHFPTHDGVLGAAWRTPRGISGWVLDPQQPQRRPELSLTADEAAPVKLVPQIEQTQGWGFDWSPPTGTTGVDILADDGSRVAGSPVRLRYPKALPTTQTASVSSRTAGRYGHKLDVIVPVAVDGLWLRQCLESVLTSRTSNRISFDLIVVDDATTEKGLHSYLHGLLRRRELILLRNPRNLGFVGSVNRALGLHPGRDTILLNSDTRVAGDWLDRLVRAAHSTRDVATVTPLSNDAQLCSHPVPAEANPYPTPAQSKRLDQLARQANAGRLVELPSGAGFCLYIKRRALEDVGLLDAVGLLRGYGEEIDLCARMSLRGWRHLCATDVFVAHRGTASFTGEKARLVEDNGRLLRARYPQLEQSLLRFARQDPLHDARRALEQSWLAEQPWDALLLASAATCQSLRFQARCLARSNRGKRDLILSPELFQREIRVNLEGASGNPPSNLKYQPQQEWNILLKLLRGLRIPRIELHHDRGFPRLLWDLAAEMGWTPALVPYDYSLLDGQAALPHTVRLRRVMAPSRYCAALFRRFLHIPVIHASWEFPLSWRSQRPESSTKGGSMILGLPQDLLHRQDFSNLLDLARESAHRNLPVYFRLLGRTLDDAALLSTGRVEIAPRKQLQRFPEQLEIAACRWLYAPARRRTPDLPALDLAGILEMPVAAHAVGDAAQRLPAIPDALPLPCTARPGQLLETLLAAGAGQP